MSKKQLYQLEYSIRSSPYLLYQFLSMPDKLSEWFADRVEVKNSEWVFIWKGYGERATLLDKKEHEFIRFQWGNQSKNEYFEFRIETAEITGETIFIITDFATKADMQDQKLLWDSQVKELVSRLGGL